MMLGELINVPVGALINDIDFGLFIAIPNQNALSTYNLCNYQIGLAFSYTQNLTLAKIN